MWRREYIALHTEFSSEKNPSFTTSKTNSMWHPRIFQSIVYGIDCVVRACKIFTSLVLQIRKLLRFVCEKEVLASQFVGVCSEPTLLRSVWVHLHVCARTDFLSFSPCTAKKKTTLEWFDPVNTKFMSLTLGQTHSF